MIVKARQDFKTVVAQAGFERPELAAAAGVSVSTIHALAHPELTRGALVSCASQRFGRLRAGMRSYRAWSRVRLMRCSWWQRGARCLDYWPCLWRCAGPPVYSSEAFRLGRA